MTVTAAIAIAGCSSTDSGGTAPETRDALGPNPSIDQIGSMLGCDSLRGTPYDVGHWLEHESEKGRDCYRDGQFFVRIHVLDMTPADEVITSMQAIPAGPNALPCHEDQLEVTAGDHWAVVSRGSGVADEVRELIGGQTVPIDAEATTFVSYFLPCVGENEST